MHYKGVKEPDRQRSLRSHVITVLSVLVLLAAAGGALAASHLDSHANTHGGAADTQYQRGKGCGGKHHQDRHGGCKSAVKAKHTKRHCRPGKRHKHGKCSKPKYHKDPGLHKSANHQGPRQGGAHRH